MFEVQEVPQAKAADRKPPDQAHHYLAIPLYLSESVQLLKRLHLTLVTSCFHVTLLHSGTGQRGGGM